MPGTVTSLFYAQPRGNVDDSVSDISDGLMYKEFLTKNGKEQGNFITLTLNSDGVPVFKSSSFSIWPLLCSVNELSPNKRNSHILLAGLWFGAIKPFF